jgi:hypothetical protein
MRVRTVGDDLSISVGQQLWSKFFDLFGWDVQSSGYVRLSVAFRCEGLDYRDSLLLVEFRLQVFGRNVLSILLSSMLNLNHAGRESVAR